MVDSSALVAILRREPGSERLEKAIPGTPASAQPARPSPQARRRNALRALPACLRRPTAWQRRRRPLPRPATPAPASTSSTRSRRLRTTRLFTLDNVVLSPHNAGLSKEAAIRMAISTARNALAGLDGKLDALMVVNREVL